MSELDRIRWQCRRGMLELDLTLAKFLDHDYAALTASEKAAFRSLLDRSDEELWALISGRKEPEAAELAPVVRLLREG